MRQVPYYLIIGNGRVARHFQQYFTKLGLSFTRWQRSESLESLQIKLNDATHILILINDQAIEPFVKNYLMNTAAIRIHFSGSLVSNCVIGAHPLMSFTNQLYSLEEYRNIPFIIDHDAPEWSALLPGLPNRYIHLDKSLKAKYHALCVLSGNFSCMLWQKLFHDFQNELNIPESFAHPYLLQQTKNLIQNPLTALTGPLVRNDSETIQKNLQALHLDPFEDIYESFVKCYNKLKSEVLA